MILDDHNTRKKIFRKKELEI